MSDTGAERTLPDEAGLRHYLEAVEGHAPLTRREEGILVRRSRAGDREAFDRLIDANLTYVVRLARRFRNRGLSDLDLIAEGTVVLMLVVRREVWSEVWPEVRSEHTRIIATAVWPIHQALLAAVDRQAAATVILLPSVAEAEAAKASGRKSTRW